MAQYRAITEGFDLYPSLSQAGYGVASTWNLSGGMTLITGRFGGQALAMSDSSLQIATRDFPSTMQFALGLAYYRASTRATEIVQILGSAGIAQITVSVNEFGTLSVLRSGVVIATSPANVLPLNSWNYIEICVVGSNSAGSLRVYLNDVEISSMALSSFDTLGGDTDFSRLSLYSTNNSSCRFDDIYLEIDGAVRVGEGRIVALPVTADDTVAFTPSTGTSNFEMVNEVPASDADYNSSSTIGATDRFNVTNLPFTAGSIYGIQVTLLGRKDDAGSRVVRSHIYSNTTEQEGSDFVLALGTSVFHRDFYPTDPNGGVAWTQSAIDAMKIGYRVVA